MNSLDKVKDEEPCDYDVESHKNLVSLNFDWIVPDYIPCDLCHVFDSKATSFNFLFALSTLKQV